MAHLMQQHSNATSAGGGAGGATPLRALPLGSTEAALPGLSTEELPALSAARKSHLRSHGQLQRNRIVQPGDETFIAAPTEAEIAAATARQLFPAGNSAAGAN